MAVSERSITFEATSGMTVGVILTPEMRGCLSSTGQLQLVQLFVWIQHKQPLASLVERVHIIETVFEVNFARTRYVLVLNVHEMKEPSVWPNHLLPVVRAHVFHSSSDEICDGLALWYAP